jgi:hypothetical protein
VEQQTAGFVSDRSRDGVIVLRGDRGYRSDAIHECMHRYAKDGVYDAWGPDFNEGVTEYFTRLLVDRAGNPVSLGGVQRDTYDESWQFVCDVLPLLGNTITEQQTALAQMYFEDYTDALCVGFTDRAWSTNKIDLEDLDGAYLRFEAAIRRGDWEKAKAELP